MRRSDVDAGQMKNTLAISKTKFGETGSAAKAKLETSFEEPSTPV